MGRDIGVPLVGQGVLKKSNLVKTFTPFGNLIVGEFLEQEQIGGALVLPEGVRKDWLSIKVRVIAAGPDCKWAKEGDILITFNNSEAGVVRHGGQECIIAPESNYVGVEGVHVLQPSPPER